MAFSPVMEEVNGIEQVKFDAAGVTHEGILLDVSTREIPVTEHGKTRMKSVGVAHFAEIDDNGELTCDEFEFLLSADLKSKIKPSMRGKFVRVTRTDQTLKVNKGAMVIFDVKASKEVLFGADGSQSDEITDADIPF